MKTKFLIISGIATLFVIGSVVFLTSGVNFGDVSYEGIGIERFSDSGFQKYVDEYGDNFNIIKITDDDLRNVPKIKDLINQSLQKEFPLVQNDEIETENNIQVFTSLRIHEIETYHKWGEDLGISKDGDMISYSILEYNDKYYKLSFTIA